MKTVYCDLGIIVRTLLNRYFTIILQEDIKGGTTPLITRELDALEADIRKFQQAANPS